MKIRLAIPIAMALLALAWPAVAATPPAAQEKTLANGLRIIVQEDHRAPVALVQVWYRVGSTYETPGLTGISHVLEHLMFRGTHSIAPGDFARIVGRFGGEHNAFTSAHYTGYYQYYDKSRLPLAFALEADRMRQLVISEEEFVREIEVVREERRTRVEDNPASTAWERVRAVAHLGMPSGQPVIGWPEDLANIDVTALRDWYDTWYAPNNAVLVVVGDVRTPDVFAQAEKYFGALKARRIPRVAPPRTPQSPGKREMSLSVPARVPTLAMNWNVPSLMTAGKDNNDAWALAVLAGVMDGGLSARFERELVRRQKVAAGAGAGYDALDRGDTLFSVSAVPASGRSLDELQRAIQTLIAALREKPASEAELARVKAQVVAELVYQQDSLAGQAQLIGSLASTGYDWRLKDRWADYVMAVTAEDVQRVARRYLVDERLTLARILPARTPATEATP
jgi:zinc protease